MGSRYLYCIHVLAIVNRAAMNIVVQDSFWIMVFSGYMPSSGIAGSYGSSVWQLNETPVWMHLEWHIANSNSSITAWFPLLLETLNCGGGA